MCGTASDSKAEVQAGQHQTAVWSEGRRRRRRRRRREEGKTDLWKATKNVATDAYFGEKEVVVNEWKRRREEEEGGWQEVDEVEEAEAVGGRGGGERGGKARPRRKVKLAGR